MGCGGLEQELVWDPRHDLGVPPSASLLPALALEASRHSAPELWLELQQAGQAWSAVSS